MKTFDLARHLSCYCYDNKEKPLISPIEIECEETGEFMLPDNEIVFMLKGKVHLKLRNNISGDLHKGQFVFLPAGDHLQYKAMIKSTMLVLRLTESIHLCHNLSVEQLHSSMKWKEKPVSIFPLKVNTRLWHYVRGLMDTWQDGLRCKVYIRSEVAKLLTMLPIYYSRDELFNFFSPILSPDTIFSEFVRMNHLKFRSVKDFASGLNITPQQFTRRFHAVFGEAPYEWMQREKALVIYGEICQSDKPLKEIAADYGFIDQANFNRFCKAYYEMTPGRIRKNV